MIITYTDWSGYKSRLWGSEAGYGAAGEPSLWDNIPDHIIREEVMSPFCSQTCKIYCAHYQLYIF